MNIIYSVIFFSSVFFADGYSYDNGILKCPNETIGQTFSVPELNNNYTKVNNLMLDSYKTNNQYNNFALSCTTGITTSANMFDSKIDFNSDISTWDTSSVQDMDSMFENAYAFNQSISKWNTSKVTDMDAMFAGARAFNQDISKWNTSKVTDMDSMFANAHAFNQDISNWDMSNVKDMAGMFADAHAFNQNISTWITSKVTGMDSMFENAYAFNQDISTWITSKVTDMRSMFNNAVAFNHSLTNWCVNAGTLNNDFSLNSAMDVIPEFQPLWNGIGCTHKCHNGAIRNITDLTHYSCICSGDFVGLYCNQTTTTTTNPTTTTPVPVIIGSVCGGIVLVAGLGYLVQMFVFKITTQTRYILQTVTPTEL